MSKTIDYTEVYESLIATLEDWAADQAGVIRRSDIFAKHVAEFVFDELLGVEIPESK